MRMAASWLAERAREIAEGTGEEDDTSSRANLHRYIAEGIGTFILVLGGVGTAVLAGDFMGTLGVAFAFGLTLLVLVYVIGPISGCHVNPAVTIGMLAARKISPMAAVGYIVAQCVGAILAAGAVWIIADAGPFGYSAALQGLGSNGYGAHSPAGFGTGGVFLAEVLLTGLLMFTFLGVTHVKSPVGFAGIAIGFVLAVCHLVSIPVDNTSVNPARSLGTAVYQGGWAMDQLWLFIVAPIIGAVVASLAHQFLWPARGEVRPETGESALPSESEQRIAQETARLLGTGASRRDRGEREPARSQQVTRTTPTTARSTAEPRGRRVTGDEPYPSGPDDDLGRPGDDEGGLRR
jgi:aquaporin Z